MTLVAVLTACTAQLASAINYNPADLMLVFRQDGQKDVEFDLGSVSNYLGKAVGTKMPITYNQTTVLNNFGGSLTGVKFALVATTTKSDNSIRAWVTSSRLSAPRDIHLESP